jgi:hypothetical protein
MSRRLQVHGAALLLGLLPGIALLAGCGEDQPAECARGNEGEFHFESDMPETTRFTGTLLDATHYMGEPSWEYRFRTNGNHTIQVLVPEVGPPVLVSEGGVYSVELVRSGQDPHDSFGIRVTDAEGLRFMAVADWIPGFSVFKPGSAEQGYLLQGTQRLVVALSDPGCDPIEENTEEYRIYRNRSLRFVVDGGEAAELYNGQSATLGDWVVHVHKAIEVDIKIPDLVQNQLSFSVERKGLRP